MKFVHRPSPYKQRGDMFFRKRRQIHRRLQAQEKNFEMMRERCLELLERAEIGELGAINEIYDVLWSESAVYRYLDESEQDRWDAAARRAKAAEKLPWELKNMTAHLSDYEAAKATGDKTSEIEALAGICGVYKDAGEFNREPLEAECGYSEAEALRLLSALVASRYEELVELVAGERSPQLLKELCNLINETRSGSRVRHDGELARFGVAELPYPDNWNDLVAWHEDSPRLGYFWGIGTDRSPGSVKLMAAEALRTGDYTAAQVVMAYCQPSLFRHEFELYQQTVGEGLLEKLAMLVVDYRSTHNSPPGTITSDQK